MRALIVAAIVLAIVVFVAKLMSAQVTPAPRHRIATDFVEETAKAATDDDPRSVRRFVDEIFNRSMFAKAPASVRDRVFRSELAFRNGRHVAIAEDTLRETINEFARRADAPGHVKTSEGQLHIFREGMRRWIPHFAGPKPTPHGLGIEMSPAEAVFIAMHLAQQKLTNPEYQVDADEWVKRANARKANGLPS